MRLVMLESENGSSKMLERNAVIGEMNLKTSFKLLVMSLAEFGPLAADLCIMVLITVLFYMKNFKIYV